MYAIFGRYVRHLRPVPSRSLPDTEPIPHGHRFSLKNTYIMWLLGCCFGFIDYL
jgi:hypothetical protein